MVISRISFKDTCTRILKSFDLYNKGDGQFGTMLDVKCMRISLFNFIHAVGSNRRFGKVSMYMEDPVRLTHIL